MPANQQVVEPVCGMTVDPSTAAGTSTHQGATIHFCSTACKTRFDAAPDRYVGGATGGARGGVPGGGDGQSRR